MQIIYLTKIKKNLIELEIILKQNVIKIKKILKIFLDKKLLYIIK